MQSEVSGPKATWVTAARCWYATYRHLLWSWEGFSTLVGTLLLAAAGIAYLQGARGLEGGLALAAALVAGLPTFWASVKSLLAREVNVDLLVALALAASLAIRQYEAGAIVAVMLLGGGVLEQVTVARARRALASLVAMAPTTALLRVVSHDSGVVENGTTVPDYKQVPVEQVQVGDIVLVRTGDRVPVDGTVQAGQAAVDESAVTGESMPVDKGVGAAVFAGSLNRAGVLEVRAEKVGRDSTLGQIIRLVEEAQDSAAPIQRLADRYARYYVPAALLVAAVVYGWTHELVRAITILVVFCPCALVLATPAAVVAGIGNAARRVILIKGGVYLEQAGRVGMVAFDKTGTLTHGRPEVTDIVSLDTLTPPEVLSLAAAAERFSEHPIGQAIVRRAQEEGLAPPEPEECHVRPGAGIEARVNGRSVLLGRMELLAERHIPLPPESHRLFEEFEQAGRTVLPVAVDQQAVGLLALRDTLRPEVPTALQRLRGAGVQRLALLTGDNHRVAEAVAREAGISEVYSGLFPEDKLALVRQWQAEGYRVAVVGDGVNDAPALVAADLGIAMGAAGTDVAVDASDITLLSSELHKIPEVVDLSRRALAVIHQNIGFSVVVNVLAVVLASLGWLNPAWGAAVHESSAMLVLLNSMRLLHYRPRWASARAFTPTVSR